MLLSSCPLLGTIVNSAAHIRTGHGDGATDRKLESQVDPFISSPFPQPVSVTFRPLIKRPPGTKYKTILSIDGGGVRGIIPVVILKHLEDRIKVHILNERRDLLPPDLENKQPTADDFDIDLTDYFDLAAGTSIGSWVALYIAARGRGCEAGMADKRIPKDVQDSLRPGSMATMLVLAQHLSGSIFPRRNIVSRIGSYILTSLYPANGLEKTLKLVFGETTMKKDLETGLLVTSFDFGRNVACSFLRGSSPDAKLYTVRTAVRHYTRNSSVDGATTQKRDNRQQPPWIPDLDIVEGTDYRLRDIALGSSSAPTYFRPAKITEVGRTLPLILLDGGVVANNPTLQALTYAPSCFATGNGSINICDVAIFSVGCGTTDPNEAINRNPSSIWWLRSGYIIDILREGSSEQIQAMVDYWIYSNLGPDSGAQSSSKTVRYGQYVRIQRSASCNSKMGKIFAALDGIDNIGELVDIGKDMAVENEAAMDKFVKDFIFAV